MKVQPLFVIGFSAVYLSTFFLLAPSYASPWLSLLLIMPLVWLSVTDLSARIIPDTACAVVAVVGLTEMAEDPGRLAMTALVAGAVVAILAFAGYVYWKARGGEALGLGDAKLIGAGILVVGVGATWLMLLLGSIGGIIAGLFDRRTGHEGVPFGPFLAYSIFITYLLAGPQ